jgi:DeoR family transcriptional regulator, fructose operon transcriptional repressor
MKGNRMSTDLNYRQEQLLQLILQQCDVKIAEMNQLFQVTEMTIRRDLEKLEQLGLVRRTFRGAIAVLKETTLNQRNTLKLTEKSLIGKAAAQLVNPRDSLFIDGGSTTLQIA